MRYLKLMPLRSGRQLSRGKCRWPRGYGRMPVLVYSSLVGSTRKGEITVAAL